MIRATWYTSLLAGALFGVVARYIDTARLDGIYGVVLFILTVPVGVLGLPQLREMYGEKRKRDAVTLTREQDFKQYYLPSWGRMFLWFAAASATAFLARALGLPGPS